MIKRLSVLLVLFLLLGCKPKRECVFAHQEERHVITPVLIGFTDIGNVLMPNYIYIPETVIVSICDQWKDVHYDVGVR